MKKIIKIKSEDNDTRLDKWLKRNFSSLTQSFIEKNLRKNLIKVNDKKVPSKYKLLTDDEIRIFNFSKESYKHIPKLFTKKIISKETINNFKSSIIYEDINFIILNKWSGIATQIGSKINISIDHIIKNISLKYNLVHRLDRETSGLLIIAKNLQYTKIFGKLFKEQKINKMYVAICHGSPNNTKSEIKLSILNRNKNNIIVESITRYKVLFTKNKLSTILFNPLTGKTHQIRIVSKHLGCPIIGDTKYNKQNKYFSEKLKLNAHILQFTIGNKNFEFVSKLPLHFMNFFKKHSLKILTKKDLVNF